MAMVFFLGILFSMTTTQYAQYQGPGTDATNWNAANSCEHVHVHVHKEERVSLPGVD